MSSESKPLVNVTVGDEVMISSGYGSRAVRKGVVTEVKRVWIAVVPEGWQTSYRFRRDDQTDGSDYGSPPRFWTMQQWAEREQQMAAMTFLQEQRIRVDDGSPWRGREVLLADIVRRHLEDSGEMPS